MKTNKVWFKYPTIGNIPHERIILDNGTHVFETMIEMKDFKTNSDIDLFVVNSIANPWHPKHPLLIIKGKYEKM